MKILVNNFDNEINFNNIEEVKNYYLISENLLKELKENGNNTTTEKEFNDELNNTKTLEDIADVLNKYTDTLGNGSEWKVKTI